MLTFYTQAQEDLIVPFKKVSKKPVMVEAAQIDEDFEVYTGTGLAQAKAGDYLVRGVQAELYPVPRELFEELYAANEPDLTHRIGVITVDFPFSNALELTEMFKHLEVEYSLFNNLSEETKYYARSAQFEVSPFEPETYDQWPEYYGVFRVIDGTPEFAGFERVTEQAYLSEEDHRVA